MEKQPLALVVTSAEVHRKCGLRRRIGGGTEKNTGTLRSSSPTFPSQALNPAPFSLWKDFMQKQLSCAKSFPLSAFFQCRQGWRETLPKRRIYVMLCAELLKTTPFFLLDWLSPGLLKLSLMTTKCYRCSPKIFGKQSPTHPLRIRSLNVKNTNSCLIAEGVCCHTYPLCS